MNSLELGKASCDIAAMVLPFIITGKNIDSLAIALLQYKIYDDFVLIVRKVVNLNIVCATGIGRYGREHGVIEQQYGIWGEGQVIK